MVLYHSTTLRVRVAGQAPGGRAKAACDIIVDDASQIIGRDFRNWHSSDAVIMRREGRITGLEQTHLQWTPTAAPDPEEIKSPSVGHLSLM